jgi:hypothetical protein
MYLFELEVRSPRSVTGGPVAPTPDRALGRAGPGWSGPGGNYLAAGGHGPPDKSLMGRGRPWIKFSAKNTKIILKFSFFCYMEKQFSSNY